MLNTVPTNQCVIYHNYHLPYNTKIYITMWKLETIAKGNFVYVSILTMNSFFVSFSAVTVRYIRYQHTVLLKSYDLKIESFCFVLFR